MSSNQNQDNHRQNESGLLNASDFADQQPRSHENTNASNPQHRQKPYWKRAHRDWRIWVRVVLMIGCMGIYFMTGDLHRSFFGPRQPIATIAN